MSETIERVARSICLSAHLLRYPDGPWREGELDAKVEAYWPQWVPAARAAIEAVLTADLIEEWLRTAPFEKVKAVHDLCHAALSDRFRQGVKPPQSTLKRARAEIDANK